MTDGEVCKRLKVMRNRVRLSAQEIGGMRGDLLYPNGPTTAAREALEKLDIGRRRLNDALDELDEAYEKLGCS